MKNQFCMVTLLVFSCLWGEVQADAPQVFNQPFHQSPTVGGPDDVILIAGDGFKATDNVVYRKGTATTPPASLPPTSTQTIGLAKVGIQNIPHSLTAILPTKILPRTPYVLWVRNAAGEWSKPIPINNTRPLWISPDIAFQSKPLADGIPRVLKIVGRNMDAEPGKFRRVRLQQIVPPSTFNCPFSFPVSLELPEIPLANTHEKIVIDEYVMKVKLERMQALPTSITNPKGIPPGRYQVQFSRDCGGQWTTVRDPNTGQASVLTVYPDQPGSVEIKVSDQGGTIPDPYDPGKTITLTCSGSDGEDDTLCVLRAINAAKKIAITAAQQNACIPEHPVKQAATVSFGAGKWLIGDPRIPADPELKAILPGNSYGINVTQGINLIGAGRNLTTVVKNNSWNPVEPTGTEQKLTQLAPLSVFNLLGNNTVSNVRWEAEQPDGGYTPVYHDLFFKLGNGTNPIENVSFTNNTFAWMLTAISDSTVPMNHVFIYDNEFGAHSLNLEFSGAGVIKSSIITNNIFKPGDYRDICFNGGQGTQATGVGSADGLDFSGNIADGRSLDFLKKPQFTGWRAAYFWNMRGNHERLLISQNRASCTGSKAGDGEAISLDENTNEYGTGYEAAKVENSTPNSITVNSHSLTMPDDAYYTRAWVRIGNGKGLGQARKITGFERNAAKPGTSKITVTPAWDVMPDSDSLVTVSKQMWQAYVVDNIIDNRNCPENPNGWRKAGMIGLANTISDSLVDGNALYKTGGVFVPVQYNKEKPATEATSATPFYFFTKYFIDIHRNLIDGEPDPVWDKSFGGIQLLSQAEPGSPIIAGYGLNIARNNVRNADSYAAGLTYPLLEGSIALFEQGLDSAHLVNTIIHHNTLSFTPDKDAFKTIYDEGIACKSVDNFCLTNPESCKVQNSINDVNSFCVMVDGENIQKTTLYGNACADTINLIGDSKTAACTINLDDPNNMASARFNCPQS